jgi:hypothetical protein
MMQEKESHGGLAYPFHTSADTQLGLAQACDTEIDQILTFRSAP